MRLPALARKTHKWLALIIAVQAVFWMLSGLYMTAIHIDIIHGDHLVRAPGPQAQPLASLVEPGSLIPGGTRSVRLDTQLGQPVYIVDAIPGRMLFDARNGEMLSPLDEKAARDRAVALYAGKGASRRSNCSTPRPARSRTARSRSGGSSSKACGSPRSTSRR